MERSRFRKPALLLVLAGLTGLAGCEGKLAKLSDTELQDRMYECNTTTDQSPGMAISCDNYRRECERRREEGRFVC
jgi:hypothetical protein